MPGKYRLKNILMKPIGFRNYDPDEPEYTRCSMGGLMPEGISGARIITITFPVKIKQYFQTKFSNKVGVRGVKEEWRYILGAAIHDLKLLNYTHKDELHIIVYKFHLKAKYANPDSFTTVMITDVLLDSFLLKGDTYQDVVQVTCGVYDEKHQGTEILLLPISELNNHPKLLPSIIKSK